MFRSAASLVAFSLMFASAPAWAGEHARSPGAESPLLPVSSGPPTASEAPVPPGRAMFRFGVFGVIFGALNIAGGVSILAIDPGHAGWTGAVPLTLGVASVTLGALGIHYGQRRKLAHRAWQARTGLDLDGWRAHHPGQGPPPGRGLVIGGSLLGSGGLALFVSGLALQLSYEDAPRWAIFNIAAGGAILVGAGVMVGLGSKQVHRHRQRSQAAGAWVVPTPWAGPRGFGFGVAGQF